MFTHILPPKGLNGHKKRINARQVFAYNETGIALPHYSYPMKKALKFTAVTIALLLAAIWVLGLLLKPAYPGKWALATEPEQTPATPFSLDALPARYRKPNIVLILSDDQGWSDIGYNRMRSDKDPLPPLTPTLDQMAADGIVFDRFYAPASTCRASRAGYLTGRDPTNFGMRYNDGVFPESETTIAEALKSAGYLTGHFGKWHLGHVSHEDHKKDLAGGVPGIGFKPPYSPPWANGFDTAASVYTNLPTFDPARRYPSSPFPQSIHDPHYYGIGFWDKPIDGHEGMRMALDKMQGSTAEIIMDRALPFMQESARQEKPFLAVIWFHAPHPPLRGDTRMLDGSSDAERRYLTSSLGIFSLMDSLIYQVFNKLERLITPVAAQSLWPSGVWTKFRRLSLLHKNFNMSMYAMDRQIHRLRQSLRTMGIADNTLIWFSSDNGLIQKRKPYSPLRGFKGLVFEGGIRVPSVLEWPGVIKKHRVITQPVSGLDQYPTLTDIVGIKLSDQKLLDGVSLLPLIEGRELTRQIPLPGNGGLIDGDYKLMLFHDDGCETQRLRLYDVTKDLKEERDLAVTLPDVRERILTLFNRHTGKRNHPPLCSVQIGGKICARSCTSVENQAK